MSLGEDLRTYIITHSDVLAELPNAASLGVVEQNKTDISETAPTTRIWFGRRSHEQDLGISGAELLAETYFDIEVISEDIDTSIDLADTLKEILHGYQGMMGSSALGAVFCLDHSDDYVPFNLSEDEGCHIASLDLQILH